MQECLQCLKRNKSKLSEDQETLCAFFLVAIQDDGFDAVRDTIIETHDTKIDDLLSDICTKDTSLQMKEGVCKLQGDGTTAISRRAQSSTLSSFKNNNVADAINAGKWIIPSFPPGWSKAIDHNLEKFMTNSFAPSWWE